MKLPGMDENESNKSKSNSEKRKEELKKSLAKRLTAAPLIEEYDSKVFEADLKYFREWFRKQEKHMKDKYDYFYGPLSVDEEERRKINFKRKQRQKRRRPGKRILSMPERSTRRVKYSLSYSPPKRGSSIERNSSQQRFDVTIDDGPPDRESSTDHDQNDYKNFYMNFEERKDDKQGMNELMKFFYKLTTMITGPDHEYAYLR